MTNTTRTIIVLVTFNFISIPLLHYFIIFHFTVFLVSSSILKSSFWNLHRCRISNLMLSASSTWGPRPAITKCVKDNMGKNMCECSYISYYDLLVFHYVVMWWHFWLWLITEYGMTKSNKMILIKSLSIHQLLNELCS